MDRKALIRQYKDAPRPMGVYRIHNTTTGQFLIGTSLDAPAARLAWQRTIAFFDAKLKG